jgi:hypothetical protein
MLTRNIVFQSISLDDVPPDSKTGGDFFGEKTGRVLNSFILFCEIGELAVVCIFSSTPKLNRFRYIPKMHNHDDNV